MYPSRSELNQIHKSVQFSLLAAPHFIPSSQSCDHLEPCECLLEFSCPLCPFSADQLDIVENHYESLHWSHLETIGKFTVLPCGVSHVTARQSVALLHNRTSQSYHFHCPLCLSILNTGGELQTHFQSSHLHASNADISSPILFLKKNTRNENFDAEFTCSKIRFNPDITLLEFPLALSIAEQQGGRSETRKPPTSYEGYCFLHDLSQVTSTEIIKTGCNRPALKLFKDCFFLICGADLAPSTISAIHSLGGTLTGSSYLESDEWKRITHILLANRIGPKSVRALKKTVSSIHPRAVGENKVEWVSSEWVRERVEKGSLTGPQRVFSPTLIERYFLAKETALRAEKRGKLRFKPDIPTISFQSDLSCLSETSSRRPSPPVLDTSSNESSLFKPTPEASPLLQASPLDESALRVIENSISQDIGKKKPISQAANIEPWSLRRSRRLSAVGGFPGKLQLLSNPQHAIKKE